MEMLPGPKVLWFMSLTLVTPASELVPQHHGGIFSYGDTSHAGANGSPKTALTEGMETVKPT